MPDSFGGEQQEPVIDRGGELSTAVELASGFAGGAVAATIAEIGARLTSSLEPNILYTLSSRGADFDRFMAGLPGSLSALYLNHEPWAAVAVFGLGALIVGMKTHEALHPD